MENNNSIPNQITETNTMNSISSENITNIATNKPTKRKKIIIIVAIFILLALLVTYFFFRTLTPVEEIPTFEEKMNNIENAVKETEKIGLPEEKKQIDIMNYNQAE